MAVQGRSVGEYNARHAPIGTKRYAATVTRPLRRASDMLARMKRHSRLAAFALSPVVVFTALLGVAGCDDSTPVAGANGGACRLGAMPCDDGLVCVAGTCQPGADASTSPSDRFAATLTIEDDQVAADGQTLFSVQVDVSRIGDDGARTPLEDEGDSGLFVSASPPEAGRVEPGRPTFIGGVAFVDFIPCDRRTATVCPASAVIRIAHDDAPSTPIAESERFLLTDPSPPDGGADAPDGG